MSESDVIDYDLRHLDWMMDRANAMQLDPDEWQHRIGLTKEEVANIDGLNQNCDASMNKVAALESINRQIVSRGEVTLKDISTLERICPGIVYKNAMLNSQLANLQRPRFDVAAGNEFVNPLSILKWGLLAVIITAIVKVVRWVRAVYVKNIKPGVQMGKSIMDAVRDTPFVKKMMSEMNDLADPAVPPDERVAKFTSTASDSLKDQIRAAASKAVDDNIAGFNESVKTQTAGTFKCNQKPANERVTKMLNDQLRDIGCNEAEYGFTNDVKSCFIELYQSMTHKNPTAMPKGSMSIVKFSRMSNVDFAQALCNLRVIFVHPQLYSSPILVDRASAMPLIRSQITGMQLSQDLFPLVEDIVDKISDRLKDSNPDWAQIAQELQSDLSKIHHSFDAVFKHLMGGKSESLLRYQNIDMSKSPRTILPLVSIHDRPLNDHLSQVDRQFDINSKPAASVADMLDTIGGDRSDAMATSLAEVREKVLLLKDLPLPDRLNKRLADVQKEYDKAMQVFDAEFSVRFPGRTRPYTDLDDRPVPGPYELGTILNNLMKLLNTHRTLTMSTSKVLHHVTMIHDAINGDMQAYTDFGKRRIELMVRLNANKKLFDRIAKQVS